mmetsp:Transcript_40368/g.108287  ORF Transcript_40368/g.108287 Transcript_40368/m.108287 type:complete len:292 (-) Transcript_40368:1592-2467(-)
MKPLPPIPMPLMPMPQPPMPICIMPPPCIMEFPIIPPPPVMISFIFLVTHAEGFLTSGPSPLRISWARCSGICISKSALELSSTPCFIRLPTISCVLPLHMPPPMPPMPMPMPQPPMPMPMPMPGYPAGGPMPMPPMPMPLCMPMPPAGGPVLGPSMPPGAAPPIGPIMPPAGPIMPPAGPMLHGGALKTITCGCGRMGCIGGPIWGAWAPPALGARACRAFIFGCPSFLARGIHPSCEGGLSFRKTSPLVNVIFSDTIPRALCLRYWPVPLCLQRVGCFLIAAPSLSWQT